MSDKVKEDIRSAVITFIATFAVVVASQIDTIGDEALKNGAIGGIVMAGVRAGVKALLNIVATWKA